MENDLTPKIGISFFSRNCSWKPFAAAVEVHCGVVRGGVENIKKRVKESLRI